jgi:signal transduction histidine kinase
METMYFLLLPLFFVVVAVSFLVWEKNTKGLVFLLVFLFLALISGAFFAYKGETLSFIVTVFSFFAIAGSIPAVFSASMGFARYLFKRNAPALVFVLCSSALTLIAFYFSGNLLMSLAYSAIPSAVIGWLMSSGNAISVERFEEQQAEKERLANDPKYAYLFDTTEEEEERDRNDEHNRISASLGFSTGTHWDNIYN